MKAFVILGTLLILAALAGMYYMGFFSGSRPAVEQTGEGQALNPREACETLCQAKLAEGLNLSNGPCLSNNLTADWVCDVAHSPREPVDDDTTNQCSEYGKTAHHFVEVDPQCRFIRKV